MRKAPTYGPLQLLTEYREGSAYPAEGKVVFALEASSWLMLAHVGSFFSLFSLLGASWALLGRFGLVLGLFVPF